MKSVLQILFALLFISVTLNAQNTKPNIIVIVSDEARY